MSEQRKPNYAWVKVDEKKCISCGQCINFCPRDVLRFDEKKIPFMKYRDDCWYCDACTYVCPQKAITLEEIPYLIK